MNQPPSTPTIPTCAALAPLLPLVAHNMLDGALGAEQATAVRGHLAECAHCQRELALHARVDAALRQAFAVRADAAPPLAQQHLAALLATDTPAVEERPSPAPIRMPRCPRLPVLAGLPAAAAVLLIALFAGYLFQTGGHRIPGAPTTTVGPAFHLPTNTTLLSIAPVSAAEWWAAGFVWNPAYGIPGGIVHVTPGTTYVDPIIVHGVDGRLSLVPLPSPLLVRAYGVQLNAIAMDSATDGWAIGNTVLPPNADGWTASLLLHFTGGAWTVAKAPVDGYLNAIAMRTASDGWIAGLDNSGNTLVLHYDGTAWTPVRDPALAQLAIQSIAIPAANDVWLAGYSTGNGPLAALVHYDGTHWTVQSGPCPNTQLASIAFVASGAGWAIANPPSEHYPGTAATPVAARILSFRGGAWKQQAAFLETVGMPYFDLTGLAMRSSSDGWVVGSQGMLVHYTGGHWRQMPSPTTRELLAVILAGAAEGWAVGDGVILHLSGGRWTVAASSPGQLTAPITPSPRIVGTATVSG